MIVKKRLVGRARHFLGTNLYETRLWLALLNHSISTAGELAEAAGVPRSRSYDVLESLAEKGLVIIKSEGRPLKYAAVPPQTGVENLKKFYEMESEDSKARFDTFRESSMAGQLKDIYKKGEQVMEMPEITGLVRQKNNVFSQIATLMGRAENSARLMLTESDVDELNAFYVDAFKDARARGANVQIIVPEGTNAGELGKYADVKEHGGPMTRSVVVDDKETMMMFMNPDEVHHSFDAGVCVTSPHTANTLGKLFQGVWDLE